MGRRLVCILFAAAVVMTAALPSKAAEESGAIRVTLRGGNTAAQGGELTLYRVADTCGEGYLLQADFGGGIVKEEDAMSAVLAQWLAETADAGGIGRLLDADGTVEFADLPEGLYLVVQSRPARGFADISPFLVQLPYQDQWYIQCNPKMAVDNPQTGDGTILLLGSVGMLLSGAGLVLCALLNRKR